MNFTPGTKQGRIRQHIVEYAMKRKEIEQLQAAGIITAEQAGAIADFFRLNATSGRPWLVWSLSSLAGALILGGIIMLISANWDAIPDLVKMCTAMALLLGFWVACIKLRKGYPLVAEGMGMVGAGMWLACIALYGQIFQLQNPFAEGCMLFFLGICAIPFLLKQRLLMLGVAITSIVLLEALVENDESALSLHAWLDGPVFTLALAALALAWWLFAEHCHGLKNFMHDYRWLGIPAMVMFLIIVQIPLFYGELDMETTPCFLGLLLLMPLMLLAARPRHIAWSHWGGMVALLGLALPLGCTFSTMGDIMQLPGIATGLLMGCGLMWMGHRGLRLSWLNYGSFLVLCAGLALIANVLDSLSESGLVLIVAGLLMLGLVWLLERQRRQLAQAIKHHA